MIRHNQIYIVPGLILSDEAGPQALKTQNHPPILQVFRRGIAVYGLALGI